MTVGNLVQIQIDYAYDVPAGTVGMIIDEEEVVFDDDKGSEATEVLFRVHFGEINELCYKEDLGVIQ